MFFDNQLKKGVIQCVLGKSFLKVFEYKGLKCYLTNLGESFPKVLKLLYFQSTQTHLL